MSEQPPRIENQYENEFPERNRAEKELIWEQKLKELDEAGDLLGNGLDEQIKEVVAVLNLNGFNTNQSCEGHADSGLSAPWVSIEAPDEPEARFVGENEVYQNVAKRYGITLEDVKKANNEAAWVEANKLMAENEETIEFQAWRKENEKLRSKAENLIEQFYKNRTVDESSRFEFENIGGDGHFRIHNGGEDYIPVEEMDEQQKKGLEKRLLKYREEMKSFGNFLKDKFFRE